jgi:NAD(P)-dependent dehydrogenase (short-subunit alcohol dehydrogenase family)
MPGEYRPLEGKVAIVTGAGLNDHGLNIGGAIVEVMAQRGASVVAATRTLVDAERLVDRVRANGGSAIACHLDQGNEVSIRATVDLAVKEYGGLDIMINNATGMDDADIDLDTPVEVWDKVFAINGRGVFLFSKFSLPLMLARGGGSIVNISSSSGVLGDVTRIAYGASKGAINTLTKSVATIYGKQGIRCNAITPGLILSSKAKKLLPEPMLQIFEKHTMVPHLGEPEHIAYLAAFLASDEAAFVTGAIMAADGGQQAHQPYAPELRALTSAR